MLKLVILTLFSVFLAPAANANHDQVNSTPLSELTTAQILEENEIESNSGISFATSNSIEPFFFADFKGGVQFDLLQAALDIKGITLNKITLAPNLRAERLVTTKVIDCMINTPNNIKGLYLTQGLIEYQNSIFFLSKNNLTIDTIADLVNYSLLAFQNAKEYLGQEFKEMAMEHEDYNEITNQKSQVMMLFNHHVQTVVMETHIFDYYKNVIKDKMKTRQAVTRLDYFKPAPRLIGCHNKATAELIDNAISLLKQSSQYQQILDNAEANHYQPKPSHIFPLKANDVE